MAGFSRVHIIGASGRTGAGLARTLLAAGRGVVPVVRNPARWAATGIAIAPALAELEDAAALRAALAGASHIVSTAHARHAGQVLAAAPPDAMCVFLGSTRKFTRFPDEHGDGVIAGEAALLASGRPGVMLHPTMIYGAEGEDNVQRLAGLLRRLPLVPLPGAGRALVQPIHQSDVARAILAALARDWDGPRGITIAGPTPLSYADFVRAIARAAGLPRPRILPLPAAMLMLGARLAALVPGLPRVRPAEIRRLLEDKAFDIGPMRAELGFAPIALDEGLLLTFRG